MLEASCSHLPVSGQGLCVFPVNPGEEIVSCKVPGLRRGKEPVLACLENTARMKKKKNPEECASHNLQACSLWFWEHLAALGYIQRKGRHITLPPQSGGKPGCFFIAKYPLFYLPFLCSEINTLQNSGLLLVFALLGVSKPFG